MPENAHSLVVRRVGRYTLHEQIASGGMAAVFFGRLNGAAGFKRTVAIKRLHAHYLDEQEFVTQFVDEARLTAFISHPNVVQTLDVVRTDGELLLVMEYVHGETLARLLTALRAKKRATVPIQVATTALAQALHGLHAAHEARDDMGQPLGIVHRDVSPQNILIGCDGVARVLDFGIAKARLLVHSTEGKQLKGKIHYMAPEQVLCETIDRRTDVFAAGIVLWRLLTGQHLFGDGDTASVLHRALSASIPAPSSVNPDVPSCLDEVALKALAREPSERFQTAADFAVALERALRPLSPVQLGQWVSEMARESLVERERVLGEITRRVEVDPPPSSGSYESLFPPEAPAAMAPPDEWGTEKITGGGWLAQGQTQGSIQSAARSRGSLIAIAALAAVGVALAGTFGLRRAATPGAASTDPARSAGITARQVVNLDDSAERPAEPDAGPKPLAATASSGEPGGAESAVPIPNAKPPSADTKATATAPHSHRAPAAATRSARPRQPASTQPRDPLSRRK